MRQMTTSLHFYHDLNLKILNYYLPDNKISGAKYSGVPHILLVFASIFNILLNPKSANFICPSEQSNIFSGLRSLYIIF